jgi:hypothetical protein
MRAVMVAAVWAVMFSSPVGSHAQSFGDWYAETSDPATMYAASVNDSGNVLGQYCFPDDGACVWLIGIKTGCEPGGKYPVLANSDTGAAHLDALCGGKLSDGLYRYAFSDFSAIDNFIKQATRVGFALPLQEDQFRVIRFNLDGASRAVSVMRAAATAAHSRIKPASRGTRDERL